MDFSQRKSFFSLCFEIPQKEFQENIDLIEAIFCLNKIMFGKK